MSDLRNALRSALVSQFGLKEMVIEDDTELFYTGLIDSLGVIDLVTFVEGQIGRPIPMSAVTVENFGTVNRIVSFAEKLASRSGDT
jgi:acyl carrier protein